MAEDPNHDHMAQRFADALHALEDRRDLEAMASLFTDDADVSNPLVKHEGEGRQGARDFWSKYRGAFDEIKSTFRHVITNEQDGSGFLEWVSEGSMAGQPVRYGGVSVIEFSQDKVTAFRTYFDPTQLRHAQKG